LELQSRWMGANTRRGLPDAYRHATVDERLGMVKGPGFKTASGSPKASMYFELPRTKRERYLDGEAQAFTSPPWACGLHDLRSHRVHTISTR